MITDTRSIRNSFAGQFGFDSSSPDSEKVVLRKRPRVGDEELGKLSKKISLHKVFGKGLKRQYDYQTPDPIFSADNMSLTADYTEDMIQVIDEGAESDLLDSDGYSYDQEGTPISKTKKLHGLHRWLGKIHHYGRQTRLSKLRHERSTSHFIHQKILSTPIDEELPDDAYSCYHQYKTENYDNYFDTLMLKNSDKKTGDQTDKIPIYSPLNELTYENLQSLRKQLFALPPLTAESNSESESESGEQDNPQLNEPEEQDFKEEFIVNIPHELSDSATAETISEIGTPSDGDNIADSASHYNETNHFHPLLRLVEQQTSATSSTSAQQDSAEFHQPLSFSDKTLQKQDLTQKGLSDGQQSEEFSEAEPDREEIFSPAPKAEILRTLFEDHVNLDGNHQYGMNSPQFKEPETISLDEAMLDPLEEGSSVSLPRSRSVLKRVISAFKNEKRSISDLTSLSSHSTYCPISVVVPALKQDHNIISGLAENLSEGIDIDERYEPDDFSSHSDPDSNKISSIKDPRFFTGSKVSPPSLDSPESDNSKIASIKFDKFAQLLLYDGSKRSKYQKANTLTPSHGKENFNHQASIEKRSEKYKNRGSLNLKPTSALSPNSVHKLKTLKLSTLSRFSTQHHKADFIPPHQYSSIDQIVSTLSDPLVSVRPILKSRHNVNASVESVRANFCDRVEVDDFMDFFEDYERHRSESEPYLGKVREKQLMKYYNSSESTSPTTDESALGA